MYDFFFGVNLNFPILISFIFYLSRVYPSYVMAKRANLKRPWMMFIPILGELHLLHLAGISYWFFLLTIIPFVNVILYIVVYYRILQNFGFGVLATFIGIVFSFIAFLTFWYIVIARKEFVGSIPMSYTEDNDYY